MIIFSLLTNLESWMGKRYFGWVIVVAAPVDILYSSLHNCIDTVIVNIDFEK